MNADSVIAALDLPPGARGGRRVPKTLLVEHGAPTAADKRRINEGIEAEAWLAHEFVHILMLDEAHAAGRNRLFATSPDLDYRAVFAAIDAAGYSGYVGLEFRPCGEAEAALRRAMAPGVQAKYVPV